MARMKQALRYLALLPGLLMGVSGVRWIIDPAGAAEGLGLPLLEGVGRSTEIGDIGGFFLATTALIVVGVVRAQAPWLQAAALLVGAAAVMRVVAWAAHGAAFTGAFIGFEVVMTAILLAAAWAVGSRDTGEQTA
jgi:hypothetical protein